MNLQKKIFLLIVIGIAINTQHNLQATSATPRSSSQLTDELNKSKDPSVGVQPPSRAADLAAAFGEWKQKQKAAIQATQAWEALVTAYNTKYTKSSGAQTLVQMP